jgi:hypothetical protein
MTDPASYRAGLEAAAQVASDEVCSSCDDDHQLGWSRAAEYIAAAILALPAPAAPADDEARNVRMSPQAIALQECEAVCATLRMENERLARSAIIPTGWKLVPVEATQTMIDAGERHDKTHPLAALGKAPVRELYAAMLAAAPTQGGGDAE